MDEKSQPDWEKARVFVRDWLTSNNVKQISLAKEAGVNRSIISRFLKGKSLLDADSAIKIYSVLQKNMRAINRREFLKALGLLPLALSLGHTQSDIAPLSSVEKINPYEAGTQLLLLGIETAKHSWEEAIPIFFRAEKTFGPGSSQAARAACETIQQLINLGDCERATSEVNRVQADYRLIMDPETQAEFNRVQGWLDYYKGNFSNAEKSFKECINLAQLSGTEYRIGHIHHFLGRVYSDWGQISSNAQVLFHQSENHFAIALQNSLKYGNDANVAFEFFRQSQLFQAEGKYHEAQAYRKKSIQMFGRDMGRLHAEIEETKVLLEDGELRLPRIKAESALQEWAQIKYAKGISESLKVLGLAAYQEGNLSQALELSIATLCIYPFENQLNNAKFWGHVGEISEELALQIGRNRYRVLLSEMDGLIQERRNYFSYLNNVSADRSKQIASVLQRLKPKRN